MEEILPAVEEYWAPEPLPDGCTPPQTSPLSVFFGPPDVPLATVALYTDVESMHLDLDRFDLGGLPTAYSSLYDSRFRPTGFRHRFPKGAVIHNSSSLLFACWHPDDDWKRIATHELVHAMQLTQWDVDSGTMTSPYDLILKEGTRRHTEHALGYLDRYDLCTDGPVPIWLAEGGELHEALEFLLYEIGASLVGGLGSHEQRQRLLSSDMLPGFAMRDGRLPQAPPPPRSLAAALPAPDSTFPLLPAPPGSRSVLSSD